MTHQFTVSAAAAARLLLKAARISANIVTLVADVVEGRTAPDSDVWAEYGAEGVALGEELKRAIGRSRRAREAARRRRETSVSTSVHASAVADLSSAEPTAELDAKEYPWEMRRTSRGMERFYRWPDRSWRRIPPTPDALQRLSSRHRR